MSKSIAIGVLILAIASGLIAGATVVNYVRQQKSQLTQKTPALESVVIAKESIPAGSRIEATQIAVVQRLPSDIPANAIHSDKGLQGRVTKSAVYPGEIIVENRLVEPGSVGGLPALIPEGMRAMTLRVDDTISVAGFVRPGHHVDILTTIDVDKVQGKTFSKAILQDIQVIATGQEIENNDEKKAKVVSTVTVLVKLEQAERLTLAANAGMIRLVLRSLDDDSQIQTPGVSLSSLIPQSDREPELPKPEPVEYSEPPQSKILNHRTIEVYRGIEKSEVTFAQP